MNKLCLSFLTILFVADMWDAVDRRAREALLPSRPPSSVSQLSPAVDQVRLLPSPVRLRLPSESRMSSRRVLDQLKRDSLTFSTDLTLAPFPDFDETLQLNSSGTECNHSTPIARNGNSCSGSNLETTQIRISRVQGVSKTCEPTRDVLPRHRVEYNSCENLMDSITLRNYFADVRPAVSTLPRKSTDSQNNSISNYSTSSLGRRKGMEVLGTSKGMQSISYSEKAKSFRINPSQGKLKPVL